MAVAGQGPRPERAQALRRAGLLAALLLVADQLTKHTLATSIAVGHERHLVPGVKLVHVRNTGVAFGLLSGGGAVVVVITFVVLALLVGYLCRRPQRRWVWVPTGLLLGGAIGNLIDRLGRGEVIDFIKLPHWDAFNVADIGITFGVVALVLVLEFGGDRRTDDG